MVQECFQTAADVFDGWREDVLTGTPPVLYDVGEGPLSRIEIGPKLVTLFGGAPGSGKTALVMQLLVDALRMNSALKACVCNVETGPHALLDRQLARLSGIDAERIRHRKLGAEHSDRLEQGMAALESIADRLCFIRPPFTLDNIAASSDKFAAGIVVLDYIQRIQPPGQHSDRKSSVDAMMNYLRQFAEAGLSVLVLAALARQKDKKGRSSYAGEALSLASFRDSSELEFGADDAFILAPDADDAETVELRHLKARHSEPCDLMLRFDRKRQHFSALDKHSETNAPNRMNGRREPIKQMLADYWNQADDQQGSDA